MHALNIGDGEQHSYEKYKEFK